MDGMQTSTVSGLVERGQRAREDLEDAQRELMRALDALDVIPGHPEAAFVAAMAGTQRAFASMAVGMGEDLRGVVAAAQVQSREELERLREATRLANATTAQAQAAAVANDVERKRVIERMVKEVAPGIVDSLRGSLVIKEVAYDRRRRAGFYARGALVFVGVFLAGYLISFWQDSAALGVTVQRCQERMVTAQNGEMWCKMDGHLTRGLPPTPTPARPAAPAR